MTLSHILKLGLDKPALTPQMIADQALVSDQIARRLRALGDPDADAVQAEADALAEISCKRGEA